MRLLLTMAICGCIHGCGTGVSIHRKVNADGGVLACIDHCQKDRWGCDESGKYSDSDSCFAIYTKCKVECLLCDTGWSGDGG